MFWSDAASLQLDEQDTIDDQVRTERPDDDAIVGHRDRDLAPNV